MDVPADEMIHPWMVAQTNATYFFMRVGDSWDPIIEMELGPTFHIDSFIKKVSGLVNPLPGVPIERVAVLLPENIEIRKHYVLQIEADNQDSFTAFRDLITKAVLRIGPKDPMSYHFAATVVMKKKRFTAWDWRSWWNIRAWGLDGDNDVREFEKDLFEKPDMLFPSHRVDVPITYKKI